MEDRKLMATHRIAVIPGDGIGPEVIAEGTKALHAARRRVPGLRLDFDTFPWGSDYYVAHGEMMPGDGLETLKKYDAIYLGAIGDPRIPDAVSLRQLLLNIRVGFDQYVNLRPVKLLEGVETPLRNKTVKDIDFVVVRENTVSGAEILSLCLGLHRVSLLSKLCHTSKTCFGQK
jgi:isocitrate/isopropylmalate dehydrogenase